MKIPRNNFFMDTSRPLTMPLRKRTWGFSFSRRWLRAKMDGTTALFKMTYFPCLKSFASPNGFKMPTNSFSIFHSRGVNNNSLCPAFSRTVQSFCWSQWRTAFTRRSVEFHLVLTAAWMPLCSQNSPPEMSLNIVLVWSTELSFDNLEREGHAAFVSFKPQPAAMWVHSTASLVSLP